MALLNAYGRKRYFIKCTISFESEGVPVLVQKLEDLSQVSSEKWKSEEMAARARWCSVPGFVSSMKEGTKCHCLPLKDTEMQKISSSNKKNRKYDVNTPTDNLSNLQHFINDDHKIEIQSEMMGTKHIRKLKDTAVPIVCPWIESGAVENKVRVQRYVV